MATGTHKSTQETNRTAVPPVFNSGANIRGKVRAYLFDGVNTIAANGDAGSTLDLVTIEQAGIVIGGYIAVDAAFLDANGTLDIGVVGTLAKYASALAAAGAGGYDFANTLALNFGSAVAAGTKIVGTTAVAALLTTGSYKGYLLVLEAV